MRSSRINYVIVGIAVLAAIAGLIVAVFMVTGRSGPTTRYSVVFDSVVGIERGATVTLQGYDVGEVSKIRPIRREDGQPRFELVLEVANDWSIPEDSRADVSAPGLLAANLINIVPGESATMLEPGGRLQAGRTGTMFDQVNQVGNTISRLAEDELMPLIQSLNTYVDALGATVAEDAPALMKDLREVSAVAAEHGPAIAQQLETLTRRLEDQVVTEETGAQVQKTLADSQRFAANMAALSEDLRDTGKRVDALLKRLEGAAGEAEGAIAENRESLTASLADLEYTLDLIAQHIDTITYNLEGTSRNMNELSRRLRNNPSLILRGTGGGNAPQ